MGPFFVIFMAYIVCVLIFGYIALMGPSQYHRNGIVGKMYSILFYSVPRWIRIIASYGYACNQRNPLLQLVFLSIWCFGLPVWIYYGFPYLPLHHQIATTLLLVEVMASFIWCCVSDPGFITAENYNSFKENYPFDNMLYLDGRYCEQCKIVRPARSKHCKLCGHCVARFDHHCPWVNNCIGAKNTRWFMLFLLSCGMVCVYATYIFPYIIYQEVIVGYGLIEYLKARGLGTSWLLILQFVIGLRGPLFPALGLFLFCGGLLMWGFFFYQLYLLMQNTTTQETFKRTDYKIMYEYYTSRHRAELEHRQREQQQQQRHGHQHQQHDTKQSMTINAPGQPRMRRAASSMDRKEVSRPMPPSSAREERTVELRPYRNVYHRGIFANLAEGLFPLCEWS